MSYAVATLEGRLVADPELRTTKGDKKWVTFRVAIDVYGKETADFWSCQLWGEKETENFMKHMVKGRPVLITGTPTLDTWEGQEGQRATLSIKVDRWTFVDRDNTAAPTAAGASSIPSATTDKPF